MVKLVQENPGVEKYRAIQLDNAAFQSRVGRVRGGIELLVALGFEASDGLLILPSRGADELAVLGAHHRALEACLADMLPRRPVDSAAAPATSATLVSSTSRQLERDRIAEIHEKRIKAGSVATPLLPQAASSSAASATSPASAAAAAVAAAPRTQPTSGNGIDAWLRNSNARRQIDQLRASQHSKWRNSQLERRRAWTLADLEAKRASDQLVSSSFSGSGGGGGGGCGGTGAPAGSRFRTLSDFNITNPNDIGREALRLTNEFRKAQKLPPLEWSQELANIVLVHSRDMGEGRVPFSHQGFEKRVRDYPFHSRSAAENVAWSHNLPPASAAVDGWIDSPGHRKNLLSAHNCCGIGVFRTADGRYFLTQLFGLK
jgi:uncharacterized protein YkwD